jgi:hypothetical protein
MTKGQFVNALKAVPDSVEITVGKCVVINEAKELTGILELSVSGFGYDGTNNELHFLVDLEHVKQIFWPHEVTLLKDIPPAEHDFHDIEIQDLGDEDSTP